MSEQLPELKPCPWCKAIPSQCGHYYEVVHQRECFLTEQYRDGPTRQIIIRQQAAAWNAQQGSSQDGQVEAQEECPGCHLSRSDHFAYAEANASTPQGTVSQDSSVTVADLERIEAYCAAATKGPWYSAATRQPWIDEAGWVNNVTAEDGSTVFLHRNWKELCINTRFAVLARTDLPKLVAELRRRMKRESALEAENKRLHEKYDWQED